MLPRPLIYLITDGEATDASFAESSDAILDLVRIAVDETLPLIQIREKQLTAGALFDLTRSAANITRGSATRLLVNDRADIVLAAGADGVHLATNSVPANWVRKSFPDGFIIGVSAHTADEVKMAELAGADFALFGPVFETPGKGRPAGLATLLDLCETVRPFPVIGVGGIDASNCLSVLAAGAAGVAAIRALADRDSVRTMSRVMRT